MKPHDEFYACNISRNSISGVSSAVESIISTAALVRSTTTKATIHVAGLIKKSPTNL